MHLYSSVACLTSGLSSTVTFLIKQPSTHPSRQFYPLLKKERSLFQKRKSQYQPSSPSSPCSVQCTDQCTDPVRQDHKDVMELIEKTSKMDALHIVVSNTSQMAANAWRRLYKLQYNVNLLEFFTQDLFASTCSRSTASVVMIHWRDKDNVAC